MKFSGFKSLDSSINPNYLDLLLTFYQSIWFQLWSSQGSCVFVRFSYDNYKVTSNRLEIHKLITGEITTYIAKTF